MNVLDTAIITKLDADSGVGGVATLATGGIYQITAPQGTSFPYVVFQELSNLADYTYTQLAYDHVFYQIKAVAVDANSSGQSIAGLIADRVRTVLTDPSLNVSGKTVLYCRFIRSIPPYSEEYDQGDGFIYHRGGVYELWLA